MKFNLCLLNFLPGLDMSEASLLTTKFCKSSDGKIDILDVCSGDLSHINLKQVALLESDLSQLFKKLTRLKESLKTNLNEPNSAQNNPKVKNLFSFSG